MRPSHSGPAQTPPRIVPVGESLTTGTSSIRCHGRRPKQETCGNSRRTLSGRLTELRIDEAKHGAQLTDHGRRLERLEGRVFNGGR